MPGAECWVLSAVRGAGCSVPCGFQGAVANVWLREVRNHDSGPEVVRGTLHRVASVGDPSGKHTVTGDLARQLKSCSCLVRTTHIIAIKIRLDSERKSQKATTCGSLQNELHEFYRF